MVRLYAHNRYFGGVLLIWSIVLSVIGVTGIYLAGRKSKWGWALGLSAQVLWVIFAITTGQYGFILSALAYGSVYAKNLYQWHREGKQKTEDDAPSKQNTNSISLQSGGSGPVFRGHLMVNGAEHRVADLSDPDYVQGLYEERDENDQVSTHITPKPHNNDNR